MWQLEEKSSASKLILKVTFLIIVSCNTHCRASTVQEAANTRDSLAKGLYSRLFDYIVQCINKLLSYSLQVSSLPLNHLGI